MGKADLLINDEYHCLIAGAESLAGPWSDRYLAIPYGGHNMLFKDKDGQWWSTFFGNDKNAPFFERPGILRAVLDKSGRVRPLIGPTTKPR